MTKSYHKPLYKKKIDLIKQKVFSTYENYFLEII